MRMFDFVLMLALTAVPALAGEGAATSEAARGAAAREAVAALAAKLKEQLAAALAAGGPAAAIDACQIIAPAAAAEVSAARRMTVRRTALKVRNPANAPDAFERQVLSRFQDQAAAGADLASLEHAEIVETGGKKAFRYMRAIPMAAAPCQTCHGASLAPEVASRVRALYPDDRATGFSAGELRGAFSVIEPLN